MVITGAATLGGALDPNADDVVSLLRFPGADGSTVITDESGRTWTAVGDAQVDTDVKFHGESSLLLAGDDHAFTAADAALVLGTGAFTIEASFDKDSLGSTQTILSCIDSNVANDDWRLIVASTNQIRFLTWNNVIIADTGTVSAGTQYDVAVVYDESEYRLYVNGTRVATNSSYKPNLSDNNELWIGANPYSAARQYWAGHVGRIRITKGVARYSGNSYTVEPFPHLDNTGSSSLTAVPTRIRTVSTDLTGSASLTASGTVPGKIATDYIARWTYDAIAGSTVTDETGNHNGTNDGAVFVSAVVGNGALFADSGDSIGIASPSAFTFGNGTTDSPFSISTFVTFGDNTGTVGVIRKDALSKISSAREWALAKFGGSLRLLLKDGITGNQQSYDANFTFTPSQTYHIYVEYDGRGGDTAYEGIRYWVDGVEVGRTNAVTQTYTAMTSTAAEVELGRYSTGDSGGVTLDQTTVYGRLLNSVEITTLAEETEPVDMGAAEAALTATASLSATGFKDFNGTASLNGTASIIADGAKIGVNFADLLGNATFVGDADVTRRAAADLSAIGSMSATGSLQTSDTLAVNAATHGHTSDQITLSAAVTLAIADGHHAAASDELGLFSGISVAPASAVHGHIAEQLALNTQVSLNISEATHNTNDSGLILAATINMLLNEAFHGVSSDQIVLTADAVAHLAIEDALHTQGIDSLALSTQVLVDIGSATHTLLTDSIQLYTNVFLGVNDSVHATESDVADVATGFALTIMDSFHAMVAQGLSFETALTLSINEALSEHSTEQKVLTSLVNLLVEEARSTLQDSGLRLFFDIPLEMELRKSIFLRLANQNSVVRVQKDNGMFVKIGSDRNFVKTDSERGVFLQAP